MKELVLSGAFAPGERLPSERDFTEALGVSRTAVREALHGLEALGLVVIKQGAGVYVADEPAPTARNILPLASVPMRRRTAADLIEVRLIVEPEISALAAERASAQDIVRLRHDVEQFRADIGRLRRPPTDLQFHLDLCKAVHNTPLLTIVQWIVQFYAQSGQLPKRRDVEDHARVYRCVLDRDASAARSAMRAHLNWVKDTLSRPTPK